LLKNRELSQIASLKEGEIVLQFQNIPWVTAVALPNKIVAMEM
jgi:hypothetical protein